MNKRRLIGPIVAALVALGLMVVPVAANETLVCSLTADGTGTTAEFSSTVCGVPLQPAGTDNLKLIAFVRCDSAVYASEYAYMTFNADAGAHYDTSVVYAGSPDAQSGEAANQNQFTLGSVPCNTTGTPAGAVAGIIVNIPLADSGAYDKVIAARNSYELPAGGSWMEEYSGVWHTTVAAVTKIDVVLQHGAHWSNHSHFQLFAE